MAFVNCWKHYDWFGILYNAVTALTDSILGYTIRDEGTAVGAIEGVPGRLGYLTVEMHWQGMDIGRAALQAFVDRSRAHGCTEVITNNAVNPAMAHILATEGFEKRPDECGWVKSIV